MLQQEVAQVLATYAREALARLRARPDADSDSDFRAISSVVQTLFYGIFAAWVLPEQADPQLARKLADLQLGDIGERAMAALGQMDRKRRVMFFTRLDERHAVQYFYEPFLKAFDPQLRKQLGVYYTPIDIVRYQVARIDAVLRQELGVEAGLASPRIRIFDPCCGTGAYLVEVIDYIAARSSPQEARRATLERVIGFDLLPAPLVIARLQLALRLAHLGAPLTEHENLGLYLSDALTGWDPPTMPKQRVALAPHQVLVILGNPPYDGSTRAHNDLYIRFFDMAERCLADPRINPSGQGLISFISNYLWLDARSLIGMRQRYLASFDRIFIDCLNGDKYKTGKLTPLGAPDPSVFSTAWNPKGIQVGTAISLLVRKRDQLPAQQVYFRHVWGPDKAAQLQMDAVAYQIVIPRTELGLSLLPEPVDDSYFLWPSLRELFPAAFTGVKTGRDELVVDVDRERLAQRMQQYLGAHGFADDRIIRYCYRPFDVRWLYFEPQGGLNQKLIDRRRKNYVRHLAADNVWMSAGQRNRKDSFYRPQLTTSLADHHLVESNAGLIPLYLRATPSSRAANLSEAARRYLAALDAEPEELFYHVLAILHAPAYAKDNRGGLRQDWPRVPLPASRHALLASAELGRALAQLLDPTIAVVGITRDRIDSQLLPLAALRHVEPAAPGADAEPLAITVDWGHRARGGIVMPGSGRLRKRQPTADEQTGAQLGAVTYDVYLSPRAYFANVPAPVWEYALGGYQVLKKWLSYRETAVLGRALRPQEGADFTSLVRRLAALLLKGRALDDNYQAYKDKDAATYSCRHLHLSCAR